MTYFCIKLIKEKTFGKVKYPPWERDDKTYVHYNIQCICGNHVKHDSKMIHAFYDESYLPDNYYCQSSDCCTKYYETLEEYIVGHRDKFCGFNEIKGIYAKTSYKYIPGFKIYSNDGYESPMTHEYAELYRMNNELVQTNKELYETITKPQQITQK